MTTTDERNRREIARVSRRAVEEMLDWRENHQLPPLTEAEIEAMYQDEGHESEGA